MIETAASASDMGRIMGAERVLPGTHHPIFEVDPTGARTRLRNHARTRFMTSGNALAPFPRLATSIEQDAS